MPNALERILTAAVGGFASVFLFLLVIALAIFLWRMLKQPKYAIALAIAFFTILIIDYLPSIETSYNKAAVAAGIAAYGKDRICDAWHARNGTVLDICTPRPAWLSIDLFFDT